MDKRYILLWLEAPLQSWGSDSKYGRRDTLPFPTKSGIYGMLLAALGASGPQGELLKRMAPLPQKVFAYARTKRESKSPFLMDFQMVGSGYDDKDPWETMMIPMGWDYDKQKLTKAKTSDGTRSGTKMTYRYYLQDARFAVIQEMPAGLDEQFSKALQEPVFDLFLGRKNCIPTDFIYRGSFNTMEEAEKRAAQIAEEKALLTHFFVEEGETGDNIQVLNDVPLQFGEWKKYRDRRVTVVECNG